LHKIVIWIAQILDKFSIYDYSDIRRMPFYSKGGITMEDYGAMIRRTFQQGSVLDAEALFEAFLRNAFPTFHFRRTEVISFTRGEAEYMEGRSWNHVFEITRTTLDGSPVWEVECRRVTMGKTPDKRVYLDYLTLGFVRYADTFNS